MLLWVEKILPEIKIHTVWLFISCGQRAGNQRFICSGFLKINSWFQEKNSLLQQCMWRHLKFKFLPLANPVECLTIRRKKCEMNIFKHKSLHVATQHEIFLLHSRDSTWLEWKRKSSQKLCNDLLRLGCKVIERFGFFGNLGLIY